MGIEDIRKHLADAYWVIPDKFLAGPYPKGWYDEEVRKKVDTLIEAGISLFVNLTEPGEMPSYLDILNQQAHVYGKSVEHWNAPIIDWGITTSNKMVEILDKIDTSLESGKKLYLHCHGGIGRTGTVVGCYLVRHGMQPGAALKQIAEWRKDIPAGYMRAPESESQRSMVFNWQKGQ